MTVPPPTATAALPDPSAPDAGGGAPRVDGPESFQSASGASQPQMADLDRFRGLLEAASRRMNLVGPSALAEFWPRHAWDSAQLMAHIGPASTLADLGAGAGFPGVVLAILLKERAGARVHLVDSQAKRCTFLREVVQALSLPAEVHQARAEQVDPPPGVEIVTARACAPLPRLFGYAYPWLRGGARGLFLKGRGAEQELAEARRTWRVQARLVPSRSDPSGRVVVVESLALGRR